MNAPFLPRNKSRTRQKARIGALSVLPVFFNLNAKNVVMIGGTEAAAWKTELLLASWRASALTLSPNLHRNGRADRGASFAD